MRFNTGEMAGLANVGEMVELIAKRTGSREYQTVMASLRAPHRDTKPPTFKGNVFDASLAARIESFDKTRLINDYHERPETCEDRSGGSRS